MQSSGEGNKPARRWTLVELSERFGGFNLIARNRSAGEAVLPASLVPTVVAPDAVWSEQISGVHPDDRPELVQTWWSALAVPGEIFEINVRYLVDDRWRRLQSYYLNLLHQPELGIVLVAFEHLPAVEVPPPLDVKLDDPVTATWRPTQWLVQYVDAVGLITHTVGEVMEIFGRTASELDGANILKFLHPDDHKAALEMWLALLANPSKSFSIRQRIIQPDGSVRWIESTVTNRLNELPPIGGAVIGISHDISERLEEEAALKAVQEELRSLAEKVPVAVFRANANGKITYGNAHWYGLVAGLGGPVHKLSDLVATEDRDQVKATILEALKTSSSHHVQVEFRGRVAGSRFSLNFRAVGEVLGTGTLLGVLADVSSTAALRHQADHDSLTGLLNRQGLDRHLAALLEEGGAVVAFVDLDAFKQINDQHGHQAGDGVLAEVGRRLAQIGELVAGRWGGDEFVIVAPAASRQRQAAARLLKKIEKVLSLPVDVDGNMWLPAASIGIAVGLVGDSPSDLLRQADQAMYAVKRERRGPAAGTGNR